MGTGPWVLTEHKDKQYALFTANKNYWGAQPRLQAVRWRVMPDHQTIMLALQKGEIDLVFGADGDMLNMDAFNALQKEGKYATLISKPIASRAILLNAHQPVTKDRAVRMALQYAVNKQAIVDGVLNGTESVADTLISSTVPYCDLGLPARGYDPAKAATMLAAAGWKLGPDGLRAKDGQKAIVRLYYNSQNAQERTLAEYVQSDLKKVGIEMKIIGEEKQAFLEQIAFHYQNALWHFLTVSALAILSCNTRFRGEPPTTRSPTFHPGASPRTAIIRRRWAWNARNGWIKPSPSS